MKILTTNAKSFVGRNLVAELKNVRDGKSKGCDLSPDLTIFEYDVDSTPDLLDEYCREADFIFDLTYLDKRQNPDELISSNPPFTSTLLEKLKSIGNRHPTIIFSTTQDAFDNPNGRLKKEVEKLVFQYGAETNAKTLVYRFPNIFGKWSRPNESDVVATFCHNVANDLPISVEDPNVELTFAHIDDVVRELIAGLTGGENRVGEYCAVSTTYRRKLGRVAELIQSFGNMRSNLYLPDVGDEFVKKLHATYTSYLPVDKFSYPLTMHSDARGFFTEILRTSDRGQFSVNVSKPGITKGEHWHHTKNEKFLVVSGKGVIRFRKLGETDVYEYYVSGDKMEVVDIPVGYTHNIENLGDSDLVTFMWCNECFDPNKPDAYALPVDPARE